MVTNLVTCFPGVFGTLISVGEATFFIKCEIFYFFDSAVVRLIYLHYNERVNKVSKSSRRRAMSVDIAQRAAISRLFSPGVLRQMYKRRCSPLFARLARQTGLLSQLSLSSLVGDFYEIAFSTLCQKTFRDEYVYRSAIAHRILLGKHSLNTASMLNEFRVRDRVADVVILNGTSTVYEIKSERDTLKRLEWQTKTYNDVFAEVYVIAGDKHVASVEKNVDSQVGILRLSDQYHISTIRQADNRPADIDPLAVFDSIRTSEAKTILRAMDVSFPDVPNTQIRKVLRSIFGFLDPVETHRAMVKVLRNTRGSKQLSQFIDCVPPSLKAGVLSTKPNTQGHINFIDAINTSVRKALQWG